MPTTAAMRLPIEPLLATLGADSMNDAGRRLEVDARQLHRWRKEGGIPEPTADRLAALAGVHPMELWPEQYQHLAEIALDALEVELPPDAGWPFRPSDDDRLRPHTCATDGCNCRRFQRRLARKQGLAW